MANNNTTTETTQRKQRDHTKSGKLAAKRDRKRREAKERQSAYDKVSIKEKMKYAGKKELAKLEKKLLTSATVSVESKEVKATKPKKEKKVAAQ